MKLDWRPVELPLDGGVGPPILTSLTGPETSELQRLAKDGLVLEIGTAYGYSAIAMAQVATRVDTIDPHSALQSYEPLLANLAAYQVEGKVTAHRGFAEDVMPTLDEKYDLVFIDGDHTGPAVTRNIQAALGVVRPGGFVACHDYAEVGCPEVQPAVDRLLRRGRLVDTLWVALPIDQQPGRPARKTTRRSAKVVDKGGLTGSGEFASAWVPVDGVEVLDVEFQISLPVTLGVWIQESNDQETVAAQWPAAGSPVTGLYRASVRPTAAFARMWATGNGSFEYVMQSQ